MNSNPEAGGVGEQMTCEHYMSVFTKFAFPFKLHAMLEGVEKDGESHLVSWQPHGKAFRVHDPKEFGATVLPKYFEKSKFRSFQRQLHIYGFIRIKNKKSPDFNAYYHRLFQKGNMKLCVDMKREKIKGEIKEQEGPEPDFYTKSQDSALSMCLRKKDYSMSQRKTTHQSLRAMLGPMNSGLGLQAPTGNSSSLEWLREAHQFISNDNTLSSQHPRAPLNASLPNMGMSQLPLENTLSTMGLPNLPFPGLMGSMNRSSSLPCGIADPVGSMSLPCNVGPTGPLPSQLPCDVGSMTPLPCDMGSTVSPFMGNTNTTTLLPNFGMIPGPGMSQFNMLQNQMSPMTNDKVFNILSDTFAVGEQQQIMIPEEGEEIDFGGRTFCFTESYCA